MICPNCIEDGNTINLIIDRKKKRSYETSPGSGIRIRECVCPKCGCEYTVQAEHKVELTGGQAPPVMVITESILTGYPS